MVKQDLAVTIFVPCMCVHASVHVCMLASVCMIASVCIRLDLSRAITSTFIYGFQNNLAQLLSLRRRSAI